MPQTNQIRADYDAQTLTIYQAYGAHIARPALQAGRFVAPFSLARMTWSKPSFLWPKEHLSRRNLDFADRSFGFLRFDLAAFGLKRLHLI